MLLFYSDTSPYARKVRMVVREKGLLQRIEESVCNPFDAVPELRAANPLGRVPALILDDSSALYDSPVICQFLNSLSPEPQLIPAQGPERWSVLRWEAMADGILDAAYNTVMERRRPSHEQSPSWIEHWTEEIRRALAVLEQQIGQLSGPPLLSHLATAAALGYLDFRLPELEWRNRCPQAAQWMGIMESRPCFHSTRPPAA